MEPSPSSDPVRRRPPLHLWFTIAFVFLFVLTAIVPDWLEVLGVEGLDNGDGSFERNVLWIIGALAVIEGVLTYVSYRRRAADSA